MLIWTDTLELAFNSKSLRTICESETHAKSELGLQGAEVLKHRLADLRAATSIKDLVVGRPSILNDADNQDIAIDLCEGHRLVFCANHPKNPVTKSGELDWLRVSRIKILRIERNYD